MGERANGPERLDHPGPHDAPVLRTGLTIQGLGPHVQLCSRYSVASGTQLGAQVGGCHPARNEGGGFVQVLASHLPGTTVLFRGF